MIRTTTRHQDVLIVREVVNQNRLVFPLLENCAHLCGAQVAFLVLLPLDKGGLGRLWVLEWVGGLGHCKQTLEGKVSFVEVSLGGIESTLESSLGDTLGGRHLLRTGLLQGQGITATVAG